ncbi:MAG: DUF1015 domain-containing protein [Desulfobacterales bacterium]
MADVSPFRGLVYNPDMIEDLSHVVTPPYDVISDREQKLYYDRHPYNIIRLDKNKASPGDTKTDNPYTRAAAFFSQWLADGVLLQDPADTFYVTTVEFQIKSRKYVRFGLIARVRLEPFEKRVILPHENTFSKYKSERLQLMKTCHANFSHIFSVFSDTEGLLEMLQSASAEFRPDLEFTDDDGHIHKMVRITDADCQERIKRAIKDKRLFIADGHHRYETALNYRDWLKETQPDFDSDHPANHVMMYICPIQEGLIIRPTHRVLRKIPDPICMNFIEKASRYFQIQSMPLELDDIQEKLNCFMQSNPGSQQIGLHIKEDPYLYLLTLKPGVMEELFGENIPLPLRKLDVTVFTRLILMHMLNFDEASLDDEEKIDFTSDDAEAVLSVVSGSHDMAVLLKPPTNGQVCQIAEAGLTMPRKTTFYYPKVISGQVMNLLKINDFEVGIEKAS